jgi:hypothetical protein
MQLLLRTASLASCCTADRHGVHPAALLLSSTATTATATTAAASGGLLGSSPGDGLGLLAHAPGPPPRRPLWGRLASGVRDGGGAVVAPEPPPAAARAAGPPAAAAELSQVRRGVYLIVLDCT